MRLATQTHAPVVLALLLGGSGCVTAHAAAQPPLQHACDAEREDGCEALADLEAQGGRSEDFARAERLHYRALAIEQPAADVVVAMGTSLSVGTTARLAFNLHPMAFYDRRLNVGAELLLGNGVQEANGLVGYQYFLQSWAVPYVNLVVGELPQVRSGSRLNVGGEAGFKLQLNPIGSLDFNLATTRATPFRATLGIGMDWELALALLSALS